MLFKGDVIPTYPKMYILGNTFKHSGILVFFDYCRRLIMEPNSAEVALSSITVFLKSRPRFHALLYYKLCLQTFLTTFANEDARPRSYNHLLYDDDTPLQKFSKQIS